ncbi:universal stress protein [Georgenia yuyongxinii]|uniref:Universal stress protein n=1 Tax=Georgenia yuyongxinii TaxID=2589797 RepID=A0A552WTH7_9MICO|nr:universal stress protein [Georgenia yuyongxinii]TRW46148.1 universal stress protein [Georgenia yuyongxinii]
MSGTRYLVAYGGDKRSKDALRLGVALAASFKAELDIVLVVKTDNPSGAGDTPAGDIAPVLREQALQRLDDALTLVPDGLTARTHLRGDRSIAQGVLAAAADLDVAMTVVGAASGGSKLAFTIGPVATALLHASPVPVAMAPRRYTPGGRLERLYCALGTRPGAQLVLDEAVEGVARSGMDLRLLSLLELDGPDGDDGARSRVEGLMEQTMRRLEDNEVVFEIGQGRSMKQAIESVGWHPHSVLMVGSSRLAQGNQTFLGSTAARMLRHLPVPMIVVPRPAPADARQLEEV